ncbi:MAG: hypothetical protein M1825_003657 [Sarcosagium campestre]|nr:MAG: hypothetical protein M1825_003657 [Sarcosagium campestre]
MQYVQKHTDIPLPRVHGAYKDPHSGWNHIVMDYIPGTTLADAWDKLSSDNKVSILATLRDILGQLRKFKGKVIGSIDGSACEEPFFSGSEKPCGPFENETIFTDALAAALNEQKQDVWVDLVCQMMRSTLQGHEVVLTHGDFLPRNIIIREGKVVAILDWEMAG